MRKKDIPTTTIKNKNKILQDKKEYRLNNIDKFKEKDKEYYVNNLNIIKAKKKTLCKYE